MSVLSRCKKTKLEHIILLIAVYPKFRFCRISPTFLIIMSEIIKCGICYIESDFCIIVRLNQLSELVMRYDFTSFIGINVSPVQEIGYGTINGVPVNFGIGIVK